MQMSVQNNLSDVHELKRRLVEGEFRSLVESILERLGRGLGRLTRRDKPPGLWATAAVLAILITLAEWLAATLMGGVSEGGIWTLLLGGALAFLFFAIPASVNRRILLTLQDQLMDAFESDAGIAGLRSWLTSLASRRWPLITGALYLVANLIFGAIFLETVETRAEVVAVGIPIFFISGLMLYYLLLLLLLPGRLGRCHYKLNAWDPVSSEAMSHLARLLNSIAYTIAFLLGATVVFSLTLGTLEVSSLIQIIPTWLALIFLFVSSQVSMSRIIRRTKRRSLIEVEQQIEALRAQADPPDGEILETIMRTWDYRDRIKATRNSVLNLRGVMNFVNTLLIPLLGFLVANRTEVIRLLGWDR